LKFGEVLGEGAFGIVMKAEAHGIGGCSGSKVVAVKMLKGDHLSVLINCTVIGAHHTYYIVLREHVLVFLFLYLSKNH